MPTPHSDDRSNSVSEYGPIFSSLPGSEAFLSSANAELVLEDRELSRLQTMTMGIVNQRVCGNFFSPTIESGLTRDCFAVGRAAIKKYLADRSTPIPIITFSRKLSEMEITNGWEMQRTTPVKQERTKASDYIAASKSWLAENKPGLSQPEMDYAGFGFLSVYRFLKRQQEIDILQSLY